MYCNFINHINLSLIILSVFFVFTSTECILSLFLSFLNGDGTQLVMLCWGLTLTFGSMLKDQSCWGLKDQLLDSIECVLVVCKTSTLTNILFLHFFLHFFLIDYKLSTCKFFFFTFFLHLVFRILLMWLPVAFLNFLKTFKNLLHHYQVQSYKIVPDWLSVVHCSSILPYFPTLSTTPSPNVSSFPSAPEPAF